MERELYTQKETKQKWVCVCTWRMQEEGQSSFGKGCLQVFPFLVFWDMVSLCSLGWLDVWDPPASPPWVLRRQADTHLCAQICLSVTFLCRTSGVEEGAGHASCQEEPVLTAARAQALPSWAPLSELFWICTWRRILTAPGTGQRMLRRCDEAMDTNTF